MKAILRHGYINKEGKRQVQIQFILAGRLVKKGIPVYVSEKNWDAEQGKVKRGDGNSIYLNSIIRDCISKYESIIIQLINDSHELTPDKFNKLLNGEKLAGYSFKEWFDIEFKRRAELKLNPKTLAGYKATYNHFSSLFPHIHLSDINVDSLERFEAFLRNKNLQQTSIAKHLNKLRVFLLRAFKKGIINKYPYADYTIRHGEGKVKYLNDENRLKLLNYSTPLHGEMLALDRFIFCVHTGIRFGNLINLKCTDVANDFSHIRVATLKNAERGGAKKLFIPLLPKAAEIVKKYIGDRNTDTDELLFPTISNAQYNKHLKAIQKKAAITQILSSHVARHTFGTVAHESGIDDRTLADLMGHSDLKTTRIYSRVTENKIKEEMRKMRL